MTANKGHKKSRGLKKVKPEQMQKASSCFRIWMKLNLNPVARLQREKGIPEASTSTSSGAHLLLSKKSSRKKTPRSNWGQGRPKEKKKGRDTVTRRFDLKLFRSSLGGTELRRKRRPGLLLEGKGENARGRAWSSTARPTRPVCLHIKPSFLSDRRRQLRLGDQTGCPVEERKYLGNPLSFRTLLSCGAITRQGVQKVGSGGSTPCLRREGGKNHEKKKKDPGGLSRQGKKNPLQRKFPSLRKINDTVHRGNGAIVKDLENQEKREKKTVSSRNSSSKEKKKNRHTA